MGRAVLGWALLGNTSGKARDVHGMSLKRRGKNKGRMKAGIQYCTLMYAHNSRFMRRALCC